ncbi:MAG: Ig-like domain-containing protein [Spirochaetales bacterium]|nr:Ig-like domain-containing protein [Spirochaetales bacterium]MCF7939576.1 Ig-like domain-containing protein [Spirochaetales bacterium]
MKHRILSRRRFCRKKRSPLRGQALLFPAISAVLLSAGVFLFPSCEELQELEDFSSSDLNAPVLTNIVPTGKRDIKLSFSEPVHLNEENPPACSDGAVISGTGRSGSDVLVSFENELEAGKKYQLAAWVEDEAGNALDFTAVFYGYNPRVPEVLINEFSTQGSGNHPDSVELYFPEGGNTAGLAFYIGTPSNFDAEYILPSIEVEAGDYLILHARPENPAEEVDETGIDQIAESGGNDACDSAYDLWITGSTGIPGNNGVLSLFRSPGGALLDAALYSNRTSDSDEDYRGFGTRKVLEQVEELEALGGWQAASAGGQLAPEDAVDPDPSTGTRTICRSSGSLDTDSAGDWHIVPTSSLSFGTVNTDEVYEP